MDNKSLQFLQKLNSLSEEVNIYISSEISTQINIDLAEDYNLNSDLVYDIVCDFFLLDFKINDLLRNAANKINNEEIEKKFVSDFLGKLIYPIAPFLREGLEQDIISWGLDTKKYREYLDDFNELIRKKNFENLSEMVDNFKEDVDENEEERVVLNFLEKDLVSILLQNDTSGCEKLNGSIIYLLINKKDSLNKFIRAFLSNQEKVSSKKIIIDDKEYEPSVANWIKHFIKENGSGIFSSIALAKYFTLSKVSSLINENERGLLRKIFKIYRNLVFFPDSMANTSIEDWEIIPIEPLSSIPIKKEIIFKPDIKKPEVKKEKVAASILRQEEKIVAPVQKKKSVLEELAEKENFESVIKSKKETQLLKDMMKKYPERSLERKALESELEKITKDN